MSPETTEIRGGVEAFWVVDGATAVLNTGKCKGGLWQAEVERAEKRKRREGKGGERMGVGCVRRGEDIDWVAWDG